MKSLTRRRASLALAAGGVVVSLSGVALGQQYVTTITSQSPLFFWELNDPSTTGVNGGLIANQINNSGGSYTSSASLVAGEVLTGQTNTPALTPAGGFPGFASNNSWFTTTGSGTVSGAFLTTLTSPTTSTGSMSNAIGSVSYWINTTNVPTGSNLANQYRFDAGSTGDLYTSTNSSGQEEFTIANGSSDSTILARATSTALVDSGAWIYVAAVWNESAGTASLYLNGGSLAGGETDDVTYTAGTTFTSTGRNQFGKGTNDASEFVNSSFDDLAIWNTALTASQVEAQYLSATTVPEPSAGLAAVAGVLALLSLRRPQRTT